MTTEAAPAEEGGVRHFTFEPASEEAEAAVAAARRLVTALLHAEKAPKAELEDLTARLNELAGRAERHVPQPEPRTNAWRKRPREEPALRNPVNGRQNAFAPGLPMRGLPDGPVVAETVLDALYEGPPGYVHGGVSALLMDHLFGAANFWAGAVGPTAELTLRYRRPVPLGVPLTLTARQVSAEGRKLRTEGTIEAGGKVCVTAEGLFIAKTDFGVHTDA
ncbi:MAG: PaaI family thioesterase [Streptosporangiales bacterium]|nr:PaaI family thioesterase [Streptosporangiales bacterium]